ncbi:host attachment protein [Parvibaculum sp.]|uniref:host attachment protein n=1 Tax=Parvibaculum sp. TaxID=2024848 RepID=UPI00391C3950
MPDLIWIVVADGENCRFLASAKRNADPVSAMPDMKVENPPTREQVSDKQGRNFESTGTRRSAYEPPTDPHRQGKRDFAKKIADILLEKARARAFDKLILVAPPTMLGDLRAELSGEALDRLIGEVNKDYTRFTPREIKEALSDQFKV